MGDIQKYECKLMIKCWSEKNILLILILYSDMELIFGWIACILHLFSFKLKCVKFNLKCVKFNLKCVKFKLKCVKLKLNV